jgi:hypothetical protein
MASEWPLNDLWMASEWPLNDLWITSEWPLNDLWMTSERPLNDLWTTSEWPLNGLWIPSLNISRYLGSKLSHCTQHWLYSQTCGQLPPLGLKKLAIVQKWLLFRGWSLTKQVLCSTILSSKIHFDLVWLVSDLVWLSIS